MCEGILQRSSSCMCYSITLGVITVDTIITIIKSVNYFSFFMDEFLFSMIRGKTICIAWSVFISSTCLHDSILLACLRRSVLCTLNLLVLGLNELFTWSLFCYSWERVHTRPDQERAGDIERLKFLSRKIMRLSRIFGMDTAFCPDDDSLTLVRCTPFFSKLKTSKVSLW